MRRRLALPRRRLVPPVAAVVLVPLLLTSACSDAGDVQVSVKGAAGARPEVAFPKKTAPAAELAVKTLSDGKGARVRKGDLVVADYVGYRWNKSGSKLLASSYESGQPGAFPTGTLVPGLEKALEGAKPGARVVARIPPKDGYGAAGDPTHRVEAGDSLVYVLDVRAVYARTASAHGQAQPVDDPALPKVSSPPAGQAPVVTVPKGRPPKRLQVRTLVKGDGPVVGKNRLMALQYVGAFWRDGKVFDSTWESGRPFPATIGTGQLMKGWEDGLAGQPVGSRVLLVVPPALGYGAKGLAQAGIRGDDTLVFVVDILGAH
ncbi:FKBP-type peptidyl-prolyl cis-trans isomerase [Actinomadura macrotermitis]|uniref:Peptidyl-prolyl cis-trans isomerase n=1 Tax=Actinomadura macrotermitis TaxID=2585200 RepID=A0A7K0C7D8_9ACTN|nr:FKBP-type peptidyl-prolyl cis-trans isomerase [Actinomadura macrotermitis]MQY08684.1 hypothetical protein [Actinomadura macrotermitis]